MHSKAFLSCRGYQVVPRVDFVLRFFRALHSVHSHHVIADMHLEVELVDKRQELGVVDDLIHDAELNSFAVDVELEDYDVLWSAKLLNKSHRVPDTSHLVRFGDKRLKHILFNSRKQLLKSELVAYLTRNRVGIIMECGKKLFVHRTKRFQTGGRIPSINVSELNASGRVPLVKPLCN